MARDWKARHDPKPTSITEVARRYHAAAVDLAQTLGVSLGEVLREHRESVTAVFIECCQCDLRLPASVPLPPLAGTPQGASTDNQGNEAAAAAPGSPPVGEPPTTVPVGADLPCGGQGISALQPAQLKMLLSKVERLAETHGGRWHARLEARGRRLVAHTRG